MDNTANKAVYTSCVYCGKDIAGSKIHTGGVDYHAACYDREQILQLEEQLRDVEAKLADRTEKLNAAARQLVAIKGAARQFMESIDSHQRLLADLVFMGESIVMPDVSGEEKQVSEEFLARELHEAGREAVEKNFVVRSDVVSKGFVEWDDIEECAREGRRVQARYLLNHFRVYHP
jgi:hypothetical protein